MRRKTVVKGMMAGAVVALTARGSEKPGSKTGRPIVRIPNGRNRIALTFDDGPKRGITAELLEILEKRGAKCTFFEIGKNIRKAPELSRLTSEKGHRVGDHSMTHPHLPTLETREEIEREIVGQLDLVERTIGRRPTSFRAPYLDFDERVWDVLKANGLLAYNAAVYADFKGDPNTLDDPAVASAHVADRAGKVRSGDVILMHERPYTLIYLDEFVRRLQDRGFELVTVETLAASAD